MSSVKKNGTSYLRKNITIPDDIFKLAEGEENFSKLVTDLLHSYYGTNSTTREIDSKIEQTERLLAALRVKREEALEHDPAPDLLEKYREHYIHHTKPPKDAIGRPTFSVWTPEERRAWLEEAARKLDLDPEELERKLKQPTPSGGGS